MLKEFVDSIVFLVRKGDEAQVVQVADRPRQLLVVQGGSHQWVPKDQEIKRVRLTTLVSFLTYIGRFEAPDVFVDESGIVALLDPKDGRDTASLVLTPTDAWRTLTSWAGPGWVSIAPESIVRVLRGLDISSGVVASLRKIDFRRQSGLAVETQHGKESLGRRVEAEVQGADVLPEGFRVALPLFTEEGCDMTVTVDVEVYLNVKEETIDLRVPGDQLAQAVTKVLSDIRDTISDNSNTAAGVYLGRPAW